MALLATDPSLKYAALIYMFPLGLIGFLSLPAPSNGWAALLASATVYVVHAVVFFRTRRRQLTITRSVRCS